MAESPDSFNPAKVKDLIFAYERQVSHTDPLEEYYYEGRQRVKSIGNVLSYKKFREPELKINNILDIEKELVKIEAHLNYYEVYEKDTHVAFQEQLFGVLTNIVSIDPEGHESTIQKKRELIGETQKLATILNFKLPTDGSHSYRGVRRTYSSAIRRDENVVHSSISLRSKEHRVTSTTSHSTLNSGFQSEESLNSTKDSIDFSSKQENASSEDLKKSENVTRSETPLAVVVQNEPETESKSSSTVSKLKRFFSFKRDEKPAIHVTAAAYSGVSRTQSLNMKTSRYVVAKRSKTEERKQREEIISEREEKNEDHTITNTSKPANLNGASSTEEEKPSKHLVDPILYEESAQGIEEYRDVQTDNICNVSVSKLKSLFEDSRRESGEGNYMNFVGLLRNVDIEKKGDLNKSKSLSDLKVASLSYGTNGNISQVDLSQELDGDDDDDDDNDDFHKNSIDVESERFKSADAGVETEQTLETVNASDQINIQYSEKITGKNVELLKKTFEEVKRHEHKRESKHIVDEAKVKPVLYLEDPLVKPAIGNNEQEISNQTHAILENLEDTHTIDAHQESVNVLLKGKVEILKKAFDGDGKIVLNNNNIRKPEPTEPSAIEIEETQEATNSLVEKQRMESSVNRHEMNESVSIKSTGYSTEHLNATTVEKKKNSNHALATTLTEPVRYTTAEIAEDSIQPTGATSNQTRKDAITIAPVLYNVALTEETNVKVLASHEAAITNLAEVADDNGKHTTNNSTFELPTEVIEKQYEDESATGHIEENKSDLAHSKRKTLQLPVELRSENYEDVMDVTRSAESPSKVPVSLYNASEISIENSESETNEVVESGFQSKTDSFMKTLNSPSVSLTAVGASYFESQNKHLSSSSKMSVSYSEEKTALHHTSSTRVSQTILSSSSQLSSMNYLQALKDPTSYSIITNSNPKDEDSVEIVELTETQEELSRSQNTILEEILKNGETIQNVDEEFEKLLQEN